MSQRNDFLGLWWSCVSFPFLLFLFIFYSSFFFLPSFLPIFLFFLSVSIFNSIQSDTVVLGPLRDGYLLLIIPKWKGWLMGKEQGGRESWIDGRLVGGRGSVGVRPEKLLRYPTAGRKEEWRCENGVVGASTEQEIPQVITLGPNFLISTKKWKMLK